MELTDDIYNNCIKPMMDKMKQLRADQGFNDEDMAKLNEWRSANPEEAKNEFMASWNAADTD